MADKQLSSQHISVVASPNGVVTLGGSVQTHRRKLLAHELTMASEGVSEVRNQLQVKAPEVARTSFKTV